MEVKSEIEQAFNKLYRSVALLPGQERELSLGKWLSALEVEFQLTASSYWALWAYFNSSSDNIPLFPCLSG